MNGIREMAGGIPFPYGAHAQDAAPL